MSYIYIEATWQTTYFDEVDPIVEGPEELETDFVNGQVTTINPVVSVVTGMSAHQKSSSHEYLSERLDFANTTNFPSLYKGSAFFPYPTVPLAFTSVPGMTADVYVETSGNIEGIVFVQFNNNLRSVNVRFKLGSNYSEESGFFDPWTVGEWTPPLRIQNPGIGWHSLSWEVKIDEHDPSGQALFKAPTVSTASSRCEADLVNDTITTHESLVRADQSFPSEQKTSSLLDLEIADPDIVLVAEQVNEALLNLVGRGYLVADLVNAQETSSDHVVEQKMAVAVEQESSSELHLEEIPILVLDAGSKSSAYLSLYAIDPGYQSITLWADQESSADLDTTPKINCSCECDQVTSAYLLVGSIVGMSADLVNGQETTTSPIVESYQELSSQQLSEFAASLAGTTNLELHTEQNSDASLETAPQAEIGVATEQKSEAYISFLFNLELHCSQEQEAYFSLIVDDKPMAYLYLEADQASTCLVSPVAGNYISLSVEQESSSYLSLDNEQGLSLSLSSNQESDASLSLDPVAYLSLRTIQLSSSDLRLDLSFESIGLITDQESSSSIILEPKSELESLNTQLSASLATLSVDDKSLSLYASQLSSIYAEVDVDTPANPSSEFFNVWERMLAVPSILTPIVLETEQKNEASLSIESAPVCQLDAQQENSSYLNFGPEAYLSLRTYQKSSASLDLFLYANQYFYTDFLQETSSYVNPIEPRALDVGVEQENSSFAAMEIVAGSVFLDVENQWLKLDAVATVSLALEPIAQQQSSSYAAITVNPNPQLSAVQSSFASMYLGSDDPKSLLTEQKSSTTLEIVLYTTAILQVVSGQESLFLAETDQTSDYALDSIQESSAYNDLHPEAYLSLRTYQKTSMYAVLGYDRKVDVTAESKSSASINFFIGPELIEIDARSVSEFYSDLRSLLPGEVSVAVDAANASSSFESIVLNSVSIVSESEQKSSTFNYLSIDSLSIEAELEEKSYSSETLELDTSSLELDSNQKTSFYGSLVSGYHSVSLFAEEKSSVSEALAIDFTSVTIDSEAKSSSYNKLEIDYLSIQSDSGAITSAFSDVSAEAYLSLRASQNSSFQAEVKTGRAIVMSSVESSFSELAVSIFKPLSLDAESKSSLYLYVDYLGSADINLESLEQKSNAEIILTTKEFLSVSLDQRSSFEAAVGTGNVSLVAENLSSFTATLSLAVPISVTLNQRSEAVGRVRDSTFGYIDNPCLEKYNMCQHE